MKKYLLIIFIFTISTSAESQNCDTLHLSFNYYGNNKTSEMPVGDGTFEFYVGKELFVYRPKVDNIEMLSSTQLVNIEIIDIKTFLDKASSRRLGLIKNRTNKDVVEILPNNKIFGTIFLYKKDGVIIYRYTVFWSDAIID